MAKRGALLVRDRLSPVWLFAAAAFLLAALGAWWLVYISQSIHAQRDMMATILEREAEVHALRLHASTARPGPLPDDPHLEVVQMPARVSRMAHRVGDGFAVTDVAQLPGVLVVQPTVAAEQSANERYARKHKMLMGEGSLLISLLLTVGAMLFRLVRIESRFRREMQDFLGRVTHEMKTPLAGIKAVLQTIHAGRMPPDQLKELTSMALREAEREEHLIQNLLLAQRMRMPDQRLAHDRVDMAALLTRFVQRRQVTAPPGGVQGEVAPDLVTIGDSTAIWTILENLADNAQKYGAQHISLAGRDDAGTITVEMTDDGIGFVPELAEKLFQPFVRTQGATSQASGTGLGLSLSRALAERMGGKLTAKSDGEGEGATFVLRLPRAPALPPA
jgi:two-component system phosphate regulon sensor histidine kinase PhoR